MSNIRIIPRLDIKGNNLIKGVQLEGLRVIGDPNTYAQKYYQQGADELIYMDVVASLYGRNNLTDVVSDTSKNVFIPLTVGGGIRSVSDAKDILHAGADKVAVNTAAVKRSTLIREISEQFGSQCMVVSIEAKKFDRHWEVYYDNGRERTGMDVVEWAEQCASLGAGEILLTSVDKEGTREGFDTEILQRVSDKLDIPIIASGGLGKPQDFVSAVTDGKVDAVAIADAFHYDRLSIDDIRNFALNSRLNVREVCAEN